MSDTEAVLTLLRRNGAAGLTPLEALRTVGTMRLAARIADLRAMGHEIETQTITTDSGARVARYVLHEKPDASRGPIPWNEMRLMVQRSVNEEKRRKVGL